MSKFLAFLKSFWSKFSAFMDTPLGFFLYTWVCLGAGFALCYVEYVLR